MEILIYHQNKKASDLIQLLVESHYGSCTHQTHSFPETIEHLMGHESIHLIIAESTSDIQKLIKFLETLKIKIPLILVLNSEKDKNEFTDKKNLAAIMLTQIQDTLIKEIQVLSSGKNIDGEDEKYSKVNADLLTSMSNLLCDIYIKLSDHKYVKLYKAGTVFSKVEIEKIIQSKKVRSLYIQNNDVKVFVDCLSKDLASIGENSDFENVQLTSTLSHTNELMHELSHKIGFSTEIQKLAKESVKITLKMIGSHPRISKALSQSLIKGQNYISSHSLLLANVSCAIAAKMDWPSNTTFHKLVLASLFHDFTLSDPQMAKILTLDELSLVKQNQSEEMYREIYSHPLKSAELLRGMKEIPGDVDFLVFQHHERPDGSGFPKGLKSHQIVAISAVFIFAHDMVEEIVKLKSDFNLDHYLKKTENIYSSGVFKKIWNILADKN